MKSEGAVILAKHVVVTGRVQGVSFRAWTREQAEHLGVSGWVRNCADGSVEAVLAGPCEAVDALIAKLHGGPAAARVETVRVADTEPPLQSGFHITR